MKVKKDARTEIIYSCFFSTNVRLPSKLKQITEKQRCYLNCKLKPNSTAMKLGCVLLSDCPSLGDSIRFPSPFLHLHLRLSNWPGVKKTILLPAIIPARARLLPSPPPGYGDIQHSHPACQGMQTQMSHTSLLENQQMWPLAVLQAGSQEQEEQDLVGFASSLYTTIPRVTLMFSAVEKEIPLAYSSPALK